MNGKEIMDELEAYFGYPLPSPLNYPRSFNYYVRMYNYHHAALENAL